MPFRKPSTLPLAPPRPTSPSTSSAHRGSMGSITDSGYVPSTSSVWLSPHPDYDLSRMYENWKIADSAAQRLIADLRLASACKVKLRAAKKQRDQEQRSPKPKRKPSLLQLPFRRKSLKPDELQLSSSSPSSFSAVEEPMEAIPSVEELEAQLKALDQRITITKPAADRLDPCFEDLRQKLDDGRPVSWRSTSSGSSGHGMSGHTFADEYTRARRAVDARDQAYLDSIQTTQALQHACITIQSAHHHYSQAMDLLDAVCSPKKGRWEAIMGDEESRQSTYREAAQFAEKSQICFNECIRSLSPHWELLKADEIQDCEDLKAAGLLQAVQLYKLMYGGKVLAMGITQQVQIMMQKQEAVFARLTSFAVSVQNCTQFCETVELESRENRDADRRHLVALWVRADEESEQYNFAAPSPTSHVFHTHTG